MAKLGQSTKSYSSCPYIVKRAECIQVSNLRFQYRIREKVNSTHTNGGRIIATKLIFSGDTNKCCAQCRLSTAFIFPKLTWCYFSYPKCVSLQLAFSRISTQADSSHASEYMWALEFTKHCIYSKHDPQTGSILSSENLTRNAEFQVCLRSAECDYLSWHQLPIF